MLAVVSFSLIVRYAIWGFLLGSLLVFVLTLVKKLITLKDSPVARDFAVYTYWIVAGTAFIGLYLGFFWRGGPGRGGLSLLLFYAGLITPFALKQKPIVYSGIASSCLYLMMKEASRSNHSVYGWQTACFQVERLHTLR